MCFSEISLFHIDLRHQYQRGSAEGGAATFEGTQSGLDWSPLCLDDHPGVWWRPHSGWGFFTHPHAYTLPLLSPFTQLYKFLHCMQWIVSNLYRCQWLFSKCLYFTLLLCICPSPSNVGEIKLSTIQKNIKRVMRQDFSLFSLGIGFDVDFDFLQRIAMENRGTAQRIYANHDASEQLKVPRPMFLKFSSSTSVLSSFYIS